MAIVICERSRSLYLIQFPPSFCFLLSLQESTLPYTLDCLFANGKCFLQSTRMVKHTQHYCPNMSSLHGGSRQCLLISYKNGETSPIKEEEKVEAISHIYYFFFICVFFCHFTRPSIPFKVVNILVLVDMLWERHQTQNIKLL